jgi:hypothetical protein
MEKLFKNVQVGDRVTRMLGGQIAIELVVLKIESDIITCGLPPEKHQEAREQIQRASHMTGVPLSEEEKNSLPEWTFSINNGAELDAMLGWNEQYSGSYLVIKPEKI